MLTTEEMAQRPPCPLCGNQRVWHQRNCWYCPKCHKQWSKRGQYIASPTTRAKAVAMYQQGITFAEIGERLGYAKRTIQRWIDSAQKHGRC